VLVYAIHETTTKAPFHFIAVATIQENCQATFGDILAISLFVEFFPWFDHTNMIVLLAGGSNQKKFLQWN